MWCSPIANKLSFQNGSYHNGVCRALWANTNRVNPTLQNPIFTTHVPTMTSMSFSSRSVDQSLLFLTSVHNYSGRQSGRNKQHMQKKFKNLLLFPRITQPTEFQGKTKHKRKGLYPFKNPIFYVNDQLFFSENRQTDILIQIKL